MGQLRGTTDAERVAWLRAILTTELAEMVRRFDRRGEGRRQSIEADLAGTSARLESRLRSNSASPSGVAERKERLLELADALLALPEDQRVALELRHLRDLPVREVAERMNRSPAAVAGLLRRGLASLREVLGEGS